MNSKPVDRAPGRRSAEHESTRSTWRRRTLAISIGLLCHGSFVVAIAALVIGLYDGMQSGRMRVPGLAGLACNTLLALQFPLLHSVLLTHRGRGYLARLFGRRHGADLAPTSYTWIAALQIVATFALWSPSGVTWMRPQGVVLWISTAIYAGSWAFLVKALHDGDLRLQTGWIGWTAVWHGRRVQFPPLAQSGLFSVCRQPIYLGFAAILWTGPVWTPDRLLLGVIWSSYCVLGPLHKERRCKRIYGELFTAYQRAVPYMLPRGRLP